MINIGSYRIIDVASKDQHSILDVERRDRCHDLSQGIRIRKMQNRIFAASQKYLTKSSHNQKTNTHQCLSKEKEASLAKKYKK